MALTLPTATRVERQTRAKATRPNRKAHRGLPSRPRVNRLDKSCAPDSSVAMSPTLFPRPPCALAQRPPPAEGKAVIASPRDGRGTADGGPRGEPVRKRRPPQPARLGYSTRTPDGMGNRTGACVAQPPRYIYRVTSPESRRAASGCAPPRHVGARPHPCRGRHDAGPAAAALWFPRGCPSPPSGPLARIRHSGPLATAGAAGSITPPRARVTGVSPIPFAGADQGVTPSRPFARRHATQ